MRLRRFLIPFGVVLGLSCALGQSPARRGAHARPVVQWKTFTSPDGAFRFRYPSDFPLCTAGAIKPCDHAYNPLCDEDALVCVSYPPNSFQGTGFEDAGLQIKEIRVEEASPPWDADECVTPASRGGSGYTDFLISAKRPIERIDGVTFIHGETAEAGLGSSTGIDVYRAFHRGKCYELDISETETHNYAPGEVEEFTAADDKKVQSLLSGILHSFQFIQ
jgi:hypothetical protein